jgi:hypothetical protein
VKKWCCTLCSSCRHAGTSQASACLDSCRWPAGTMEEATGWAKQIYVDALPWDTKRPGLRKRDRTLQGHLTSPHPNPCCLPSTSACHSLCPHIAIKGPSFPWFLESSFCSLSSVTSDCFPHALPHVALSKDLVTQLPMEESMAWQQEPGLELDRQGSTETGCHFCGPEVWDDDTAI